MVGRSNLNINCCSQKNPIKQVQWKIPEEELCQTKDKGWKDEMMLGKIEKSC